MRLLIFAGKSTGNVVVKYLTQHLACGFVIGTSDFSYLCSITQSKHKDVKAHRLDQVATRLPKISDPRAKHVK